MCKKKNLCFAIIPIASPHRYKIFNLKTPFSALVAHRKTNSCTFFPNVVGKEPGAVPTTRRVNLHFRPSKLSIKKIHSTELYSRQRTRSSVSGRGTCPLTGGFAAKWHRRINGYDSGPSEPGDSPQNVTTKLWLWPAPANSFAGIYARRQHISRLLYANGLLIFCETSKNDASVQLRILNDLGIEKLISFSKGATNSCEIYNILNIFNRLHINDFQSLIKKINNHFVGWKARLLSYAKLLYHGNTKKNKSPPKHYFILSPMGYKFLSQAELYATLTYISNMHHFGKDAKNYFFLATTCSLYFIWRKRNARRFGDIIESSSTTCARIKKALYYKTASWKNSRAIQQLIPYF
ncbi:hypothetical protein M5K25_021312 [Dendrobium thyrsiflorum]|uniref:Uncharacterized protein n=1 Tax=Dendrobium thyrsiflorum TaxID=117978 RepID=A0ABD0UC28_DENTH